MKLNDYEWQQVSLWDFSPDNCIEVYKKSPCGKHVYQYYLVQCIEEITPSRCKIQTVTNIEGVPKDVLYQKGRDIKVKESGVDHG